MDHGMLTPDIGTTFSLLVNMLSSSFIYLGIIFWDPLSCFVFFSFFFLIVQVEYFLLYVLIFRRRQWHPTPVLLPGKSHGWRSLVGCSPWGRTWLSDFTFTFHFYALEKEMATHSSVLAWRIPGMGSHRVRHDWSDLAAAAELKCMFISFHTHQCSWPFGILLVRWIITLFNQCSTDEHRLFLISGRYRVLRNKRYS